MLREYARDFDLWYASVLTHKGFILATSRMPGYLYHTSDGVSELAILLQGTSSTRSEFERRLVSNSLPIVPLNCLSSWTLSVVAHAKEAAVAMASRGVESAAGGWPAQMELMGFRMSGGGDGSLGCAFHRGLKTNCTVRPLTLMAVREVSAAAGPFAVLAAEWVRAQAQQQQQRGKDADEIATFCIEREEEEEENSC